MGWAGLIFFCALATAPVPDVYVAPSDHTSALLALLSAERPSLDITTTSTQAELRVQLTEIDDRTLLVVNHRSGVRLVERWLAVQDDADAALRVARLLILRATDMAPADVAPYGIDGPAEDAPATDTSSAKSSAASSSPPSPGATSSPASSAASSSPPSPGATSSPASSAASSSPPSSEATSPLPSSGASSPSSDRTTATLPSSSHGSAPDSLRSATGASARSSAGLPPRTASASASSPSRQQAPPSATALSSAGAQLGTSGPASASSSSLAPPEPPAPSVASNSEQRAISSTVADAARPATGGPWVLGIGAGGRYWVSPSAPQVTLRLSVGYRKDGLLGGIAIGVGGLCCEATGDVAGKSVDVGAWLEGAYDLWTTQSWSASVEAGLGARFVSLDARADAFVGQPATEVVRFISALGRLGLTARWSVDRRWSVIAGAGVRATLPSQSARLPAEFDGEPLEDGPWAPWAELRVEVGLF